MLNNKGYYNFTENYIVFKIEGNLTNYTVDVAIEISNPYYTIDEQTYEGFHRKYYEKYIFSILSVRYEVDTVYYSK